MDGYAVVFEMRDATGYRTASFVNPSEKGPGDTPRAYAIDSVLFDMIVRPSWRDTVPARP
jgi:hypothetical protein